MRDSDVVVVSASRTPFGKFGGCYAELTAIDLGSLAIKNVLSSVPLTPDHVTHVFLGTVYPGGLSQVPARQAAFLAGIPDRVITSGIDKACCSATEAIIQGVRALKTGEAQIVLAGGMENMTQTPYLQKQMRRGIRMGDATITDYLQEGLTWPFTKTLMGEFAEKSAKERNISREEQDEYAHLSQYRWKNSFHQRVCTSRRKARRYGSNSSMGNL
ncbi:beta-ketoacyl synthase N-terminal-like domain-containing protein [Aneurinibacillus sp. Ricciae_BoGa-3]|uniref:thiolase family protein n=1 Tax=Aneurinibacillus sp. Ricciae_BoGa-3 TaxID=3022697 RepID=UPI002341C228|nr:beta-ketoacyl synthase N-terminal-like domain-containing protein [Aneurinibacillus sp. Ricciae_BoGa-3]WCK56249.1 beta-ketoacyl synthase N-terminal-like domain-containing protein [Aneurinibacillus sp. Ricciae_BoGa-3]